MQKLMPIVSIAGLALVILPAVAYLLGWLAKDAMITWMLVGTVVWFVTAPLWMGRQSGDPTGRQELP